VLINVRSSRTSGAKDFRLSPRQSQVSAWSFPFRVETHSVHQCFLTESSPSQELCTALTLCFAQDFRLSPRQSQALKLSVGSFQFRVETHFVHLNTLLCQGFLAVSAPKSGIKPLS
jgi:hypothetical protein